ncbi:MAG: hypothetical protein M0R51_13230 [Clostridia bacterium]|jgi:hypothetical protein|nr:hypothetical protein [Clostridia bacterium]
MTVKKIYIGSHGPYLYDDDDTLVDPESEFTSIDMDGDSANAITTNGKVYASGNPTSLNDLVRLSDLSSLLNMAGDNRTSALMLSSSRFLSGLLSLTDRVEELETFNMIKIQVFS